MGPSITLNPPAAHWHYQTSSPSPSPSPVFTFHRKLPNYSQSPLHSLPSLAKSLNLGHVLLKDESQRFGLPSFKILGASWAVYHAVADRLGLDVFSPEAQAIPLSGLGALAKEKGVDIKLVTCTEGNWGRAVARMAGYMGVSVVVYVPSHMTKATRDRIKEEGADVVVAEGDYDVVAGVARAEAEKLGERGLLVMDIAWEGYETVPQVCALALPVNVGLQVEIHR